MIELKDSKYNYSFPFQGNYPKEPIERFKCSGLQLIADHTHPFCEDISNCPYKNKLQQN